MIKMGGVDPDELRCALAVATIELRTQISRYVESETKYQLTVNDLKNTRAQLEVERGFWKTWCGEKAGCEVGPSKQTEP
jgi:hypothetical protein